MPYLYAFLQTIYLYFLHVISWKNEEGSSCCHKWDQGTGSAITFEGSNKSQWSLLKIEKNENSTIRFSHEKKEIIGCSELNWWEVEIT